jgi:hypothetical protein
MRETMDEHLKGFVEKYSGWNKSGTFDFVKDNPYQLYV